MRDTTETLAEFRRRLCGRCGAGYSDALREHAGGFHDTEWNGTLHDLNGLIGKDVDVYFNLHKKVWSVRDRQTRRVIAHLDGLVLSDVTFRVSAAGNARVRREGRKNVHAFARGTVLRVPPENSLGRTGLNLTPVTYNPHRYTTFVRADGTDTPVHDAKLAFLDGRSVDVLLDTSSYDVVR